MIKYLLVFLSMLNLSFSGLLYAGELATGVLVNYSFDDQNIETGPDTFTVYKNSKGSVGLSTSFPFSGYHSVEIKEVSGDGDFPELQGYFPLQENGTLFAHFAFLVTNPAEPLNLALAGPKWFQVEKDGIAFWLFTKDGYLYQHSGGKDQKMFELMPFTWYIVDLSYSIEEGHYDLTIRQEQLETPLVELKQQASASGNAYSKVDKFSFIGDLKDLSNVVYYLDDVMIATDNKVIRKSYRAPGRHKLFFDYLQDYQKQVHSHPICLPVNQLTEIGLNDSNQYLMHPEDAFMALMNIIAGNTPDLDSFEHQHPQTFAFLKALKSWKQGCTELAAGEPIKAGDHFLAAIERFDAPMYQLSYAMALAEGNSYQQAVMKLGEQYGYWSNDPRYAIAQAMIAFGHEDWQSADWKLSPFSFSLMNKMDRPTLNALWSGDLNSELMEKFKNKTPEMWEDAIGEFIIAEQYFYLLMWSGRHQEALEYAKAISGYLKEHGLPAALWQSRIGDGYFISGYYTIALQAYQQLLQKPISKISLYKKISDLAYLLGDAQMERHYRELVYGNLRSE